MSAILAEIWKTQIRFLRFQSVNPDLKNHSRAYLVFVLLVSWMVGIGRYWDHPNALIWQYAGLGSVAYIFVLSAFIWIVIMPLQPKNWTYTHVLVFVGLTSLPAVLYAIPVETFMSMDLAQSTNAWFLGIVALWRVALYIKFLVTVARLNLLRVIVGTLLPLSAIVVALMVLNLEHVVFQIMAGNRADTVSVHDAAYGVIIFLSILSYIAFPVTLILYVVAICYRTEEKEKPSNYNY